MDSYAITLRTAIENLINVKLHDALARPDGLDRLVAHRSSGVASPAVRQAEVQLQSVIAEIIPTPDSRTCQLEPRTPPNRRPFSHRPAA